MSDKIKNLKSYFNKGDVPTEAQFHELIDSFIIKSNDKLITTVKEETNGDVVFTFSDTTTLTIKKYKLPASMPVSFISGLQAAIDAKAAKNGDATQNFKVKDATANDDAVSKQQLDDGLATKAAKNGDATQNFKVKDAAANDDAVSKQQLDAGLATKAAKNGDATQNFKVKDAAANDDAVNKQQLDVGLATKAAKNGDNTQAFKVKNAVNADEAISKQQFDAVFNRLIPAPFIDKLSTTENKIYQQPSTKTVVNIFGSYFTPTSTVTVTGLTVSDFKFISDNQLQVSITATAAAGNYDVIVNNGASTTKAKAWIVSPGEVTVPQPSDFTIVSGQADISKAGEINIKQANANAVVKFFSIPENEEFQLEWKASKSPLIAPTSLQNWMHIYINGTKKFVLEYIVNANGYTSVQAVQSSEWTKPYGWTGSGSLEGIGKIKFEKKDGKFKLYVNNIFKHQFSDSANGGNIEFRALISTLNFVEIKKYKI